jgi:hypothetical protein
MGVLKCLPMEALHLGYSFAEYARFERDAHERHEFVRGLILAIAGGTLEHGRLTAAVITALGAQLHGRPYSTTTSASPRSSTSCT